MIEVGRGAIFRVHTKGSPKYNKKNMEVMQ
jgi:hypothetical protein